MSKNISLEGRLSFNRPIAESTFRQSIANSPKFQWGRRKLDNSTLNKSTSSSKSPVRERNGLSKIDARIYADVQSNGLTSRIVKYHESGSRLNRSISMNNLSNEGRKFAATRANKPELQYKAATHVSMTHIAPPDKSAFYGNTLSGLLRSNSVITLQHNEDNVSSENRPIIHPPPTEKELHPTRSVLEVLKEISRKRINEDGEEAGDNSKKYCSYVDGGDYSGTIQADYRNLHLQPTYKRHRESAADGLDQSQAAYLSKTYHNRAEPSSPVQVAKRRQYNYNNDITSSLSSSKKTTNKRKIFEHEGDTQQEKQLRYHADIRLPELSSAVSYDGKTPITPMPKTPQSSNSILSNEIQLPAMVQKSVSAPPETVQAEKRTTKTSFEKPKLTLFNKRYDDEPQNERSLDDNNDINDNTFAVGIQFVKPKKSISAINGSASRLVMDRMHKSKLAQMLSGLRGELYLGDEEADGPITNSIESARESGALNPVNVDQSEKQEKAEISTTISTATNNFAQSSAPLTNGPTHSNNAKTSHTDGSSFVMPTAQPSTASNSATSTKISSPLAGIKLTPQNTTTTTTPATTAITTTITSTASVPAVNFSSPTSTTAASSATTTKAATAATSTPFSIGTKTQKTPTPTAPTTQPQLSTFGTATAFTVKPPTSSASTENILSSKPPPPAFSFNANATTTSAAAAATTTIATTQSTAATAPAAPFSFGATSSQPIVQGSTNPQASNNENAKSAAATANHPNFSFGSNKNTVGSFSFGANTTTANSTQSTEAPKMFNFTSSQSKAITTPAAGGGFSLSSNSAENTPSGNVFGGANTLMPIKFGAPVAPTTAKSEQQQPLKQQQQQQQQPNSTTNSAFNFASSSPAPSTQENPVNPPINTFGALAGNNQSTPFSFGALSAQQQAGTADTSKTTNVFSLANNASDKPFSFGGSSAANTTAAAPITNAFSLPNNNNNNNNHNTQQTNLFNFGASTNATRTATATEAMKPTTNASFNFGSNTTATPAFGNGDQSKPFNFAAVTNNTVVPTAEVPKGANTFNFGSNNPSNNFTFGGKPNTTDAPKIAENNSTTSAFNFGANKPPTTATSSQQQSITFGSTAAPNNVFSFNANNNNNNNNNSTKTDTNASKSTFGSFSGSSAFTFGSSSNNNSTAGLAAKPTTFNTTNNSTTQPNTFLFGGGDAGGGTNAPAAPTGNLFAMANNATNSSTITSTATPATFGTVNNSTAQSNTFLFGGGGAAAGGGTTAAAAAPTANIFTASNNGNNNHSRTSVTPTFGASSSAVTPNIFAATPSSSDRPIKRATRRLTKY